MKRLGSPSQQPILVNKLSQRAMGSAYGFGDQGALVWCAINRRWAARRPE
jgi:hypothetical protein